MRVSGMHVSYTPKRELDNPTVQCAHGKGLAAALSYSLSQMVLDIFGDLLSKSNQHVSPSSS
jgi:hypothetical protein